MKRCTAWMLLIALCTGLTGCSVPAPAELGSRLFVENAGIDRSGSDIVLSLNGYLADLQDSNAFLTQSGFSVIGAMEALALRTGRQPYFSHNGAVIVGRDTARAGIGGILQFFTDYPECRGSVPLFVADTTAAELLDAIRSEPELDNRMLIELVHSDLHAGRTLYTSVYRAASALEQTGIDPAAPILSAAQSGVTVTGTAIFRDDRLAAELTPDETVGLQLITGSAQYALVYVTLRDYGRISLAVTIRGHDLRISTQDGAPAFALRLTCEAEISEYGAAVRIPSDQTMNALLEADCARQLSAWAESCAAKMIRASLDPMGFGARMQRTAPELWATYGENWRNTLSSCIFSAEATVRLHRFESS